MAIYMYTLPCGVRENIRFFNGFRPTAYFQGFSIISCYSFIWCIGLYFYGITDSWHLRFNASNGKTKGQVNNLSSSLGKLSIFIILIDSDGFCMIFDGLLMLVFKMSTPFEHKSSNVFSQTPTPRNSLHTKNNPANHILETLAQRNARQRFE